jgi:solute carrier family 25 (mitochondrial aspartate/glutamate transporter), member 12/13
MAEDSAYQQKHSNSAPLLVEPFPSHFKSQHDQDLIRVALHKSPFFTALDAEQVDRFVAVAKRRDFDAGDIVILEGCVDQVETEDRLVRISNEATRVVSENAVDPEPPDPDGFVFVEISDGEPKEEEESTYLTEVASKSKSAETRVDANLEYQSPVSIETPLQEATTSESTEGAFRDDHQSKEEEESSHKNQPLLSFSSDPPPPQSGVKRSIYIVRSGNADVWYQPSFRAASLEQGTLFGEGGFLFGRQHSASIVAARNKLSCYVVDFVTFSKHVLSASDRLNRLFVAGAGQKDADGVPYMTMEDFVQTRRQNEALQDPLVGLWIANAYNLFQRPTSGRSLSLEENGRHQAPRIYLEDFCFFHLLMARPDPEVDIAFLLMDQRQTGQIYLEDVAKFVEPVFSRIDLSSHFFQRYFGKDGKQSIRYMHFSQFLVDLQREIGKQAFLRSVSQKGTPEGYLDPTAFIEVLKTVCGWRLPKSVADRLEVTYNTTEIETKEEDSKVESSSSTDSDSISTFSQAPRLSADSGMGSQYFAYGDFLAFQEVLGNLPAICSLIDRAQEIKKAPISNDDFTVANRAMGLGGRLSRRQVEIVFSLFDLDQDGYISHDDTLQVCGMNFAQRLVERDGKLTYAPSPPHHLDNNSSERDSRDWKQSAIRFAHHFGLTAVASSLGVLLLYPLDLAKTRLMNEQIRIGTSSAYRGWIDCLQQVVRSEGVRHLYRGLSPQLLGVGPEKLIKLQVNDLLRQTFSSTDFDLKSQRRKINLPMEVLAGACAGACQLLVTNPMEITKIRLQLQGETSVLMRSDMTQKIHSFSAVVRDLGFPGVYRGASACLLRDVPFSAIYFPTYAACKDFLVDPSRGATQSDLLVAGTLAAVPAAFLTSPADAIKTRIQSGQRPGEYIGIRASATLIYQAEGWQAFFRGSMVRVLRIAPQFGISLLGYEQLTQWFGNDDGRHNSRHHAPTSAPILPQDYRSAFPSMRMLMHPSQ